jgi:hypothetical protein
MIITRSLVSPSALDFEGNTDAATASTAQLIGTSGQFIRMARQGNLVPARRLWAKRSDLRARLLRVQQALDDCNDKDWLFRFSRTCERKGLNFEAELTARANRLEALKAKLALQLDKIENQFRKVSPSPAGEPERGEGEALQLPPPRGGVKYSIKTFRGRICKQVVDETKFLRQQLVRSKLPLNFGLLRQNYLNLEVLRILAGPPFNDEDRDSICHPACWGVQAVRYATGILKRYFKVESDETIRSYRKAYGRESKAQTHVPVAPKTTSPPASA